MVKVIKVKKICKVPQCGRTVYALECCRRHYISFRRSGDPLFRRKPRGKCKVPLCGRTVHAKGYCSKHYERFKAHGDPLIRKSPRGASNVNWKGGVSYYKNHFELKKNQKMRLKYTKNKCEICGKPAKIVRHIGDLQDHSFEKLQAVCNRCFGTGMRKRKHTSKYRREFGYTLVDIAKKLDCSIEFIYGLLDQDRGKKVLVELLKTSEKC